MSRRLRWLESSFTTPTERKLALGTYLRTIGRGLTVSISVIYLTSEVGLPETGVGWVLTTAAVCGLLAGLLAGKIIDRAGPVRSTVVFALVEAILITGYCAVGSLPALLAVASFVSVFETSGLASRSALIAIAISSERRVLVRARLRVVTNIGWATGSAVAALPLALGQKEWFQLVFVVAAACMAISASVTASIRIAMSPPTSAGTKQQRSKTAFRDGPYVALTVINGLFCLHDGILSIAIPIWVLTMTTAPPPVIAVLLITNTIVVAVTQIWASQSVTDPRSAARVQRWAAAMLALACVAYGATSGLPTLWCVLLLVFAAVLHSLAEVYQSAAAWMLSYDLAPDHSHGQYQALFGMGLSAASVVAPVTLAYAVSELGTVGWLALGAVFVAAGIATGPATRWALRRYEPSPSNDVT